MFSFTKILYLPFQATHLSLEPGSSHPESKKNK